MLFHISMVLVWNKFTAYMFYELFNIFRYPSIREITVDY